MKNIYSQNFKIRRVLGRDFQEMEVLELTTIGSEDVRISSFSLCNEYLFCRDAIVSWLKKKTGPGLHNITTTEEAERILVDEDKIVLGYLESLVV